MASTHQMDVQGIIVPGGEVNEHKKTLRIGLFNADGTAADLSGSQAAAQADVGAMTSAAASGGEPPTEAEYNALRTDLSNTRTVLNSLLAKLRTAGIVDT